MASNRPPMRPGSMIPTVAPNAMGRPDRGQASASPVGNTGEGEHSSDAYTLITQAGLQADGKTPVLYNGDRRWVKVTLTLQTAGIVVYGTRAQLGDLASGTGDELQTGQPVTITVAKGTRIYYLASAVNRVSVQIEPLPWLEQITAGVGSLVRSVFGGQ